MLLEVLADPRGAFVMWTRTGQLFYFGFERNRGINWRMFIFSIFQVMRVLHESSFYQNILISIQYTASLKVIWKGITYRIIWMTGRSLLIHLLMQIFISCNEAFSSSSFLLYTAMPGHAVQQENKSALLDLLDALAYPSELYVGTLLDQPSTRESYTTPNERYRSTAVLIPREYFCSYNIF